MSEPYWTIPALADLYLEDSWVLDIRVDLGGVTFELDAVLRESHPEYQVPRPGEQYCYRRCLLSFKRVRTVTWKERGAAGAIDASGTVDYDNIDTFEFSGNDYHLVGSWGIIEIIAEVDPEVLLAI